MSSEVWTVRRLLEWTADYLKGRSVAQPRLEAEILLACALGLSRIELYTRFDDVPDQAPLGVFRGWVKRRAAGEPVAYLVGHKEFYSLDFDVSPAVLIPRPETEQIALEGIEFLRRAEKEAASGGAAPLTALDIGTGSGALAVTLAKNVKNAAVVAVDLSPEALAVAEKNAEKLGVADRIEFRTSDLFAAIKPEEKFRLIVSNPPYVSQAEYDALDVTVRNYEPKEALLAGDHGTEIIERILDEAPNRLENGGKILIEISPMIADALAERLEKDRNFTHFEILRDFAGLKRVMAAEVG